MISEVENIMSGQIVRKVNADKAIGVSTANLIPDEKGEVPLSKQSSFQIIKPTMTQTPTLVTEELDLMPSSNKELSEQRTATTSEMTSTPVINDTISVSPVDVVSPTQLGGLDINSIIPTIPFISEENANKQENEETIDDKKIELPKMPETILAEEPTEINNNLFVNSSISIPASSTIDGNAEKEVTGVSATQDIPLFNNISQETFNDAIVPSIGDVKEEILAEKNLNQTMSPFENIVPEAMNTTTLSPASEVPQETFKESSLIQDMPLVNNNSQEFVSTPKIPTLETNEELNKNNEEININSQLGNKDEKDKKIDMILNKLDELVIVINNINEKMDLTINNEKMQSPVLPQESVPNVNSTVPVMEPVTEKQEEFVDALSQIGSIDELKIDEAPIKGGMFI